MSMLTGYSTSIRTANAATPQKIGFARNQLKMCRIATRTVLAKMVNFFITVRTKMANGRERYFFNPSQQHTVNATCAPVPANLPITCRRSASSPNPARRSLKGYSRVNLDFRENPLQVFSGEMVYGKIFRSHYENILSSVVRAAWAFAASVWPALCLGV